MSEVGKIVGLLKSDAIEKKIAAAIVLGELKAKGPGVVEGLAATLESGVPLLQVHALDALARVGAKKALPQIFPLLSQHDDDVRRAATRAVASVGEEVVPIIKEKMGSAGPEERRALDAALAELGGKDAFSALIKGLASSDAEAAKAAALAVRQQIKNADGNKRRSYLAEVERFLDAQKKKAGAAGAIAAAVKILGYLEDEKTIPTLLAYANDEKADPSVRQEAIIAFRFALSKDKPSAKVVDTLVKAAEAPDRTLAQTALHTLGSLQVSDDTAKRLEKIALHPDFARASFVLDLLGRMGGAAASSVLTKVLVSTADRRYAEAAANGIAGKEEAVPALAKALLEATNPDRAWVLAKVLRPTAKKIAPALRKQLLEEALDRLGKGERNYEAHLDVARDADPDAVADALRALAGRLRKKDENKARVVLSILCKMDRATNDDRYALASLELSLSNRDTRPASRAGDESLRILGALLRQGFDVAKSLKKDRALELDHLYYVGFHFTELNHPLGEELLEEVVKKGGRAKVAKMAKNKLALAEA
ncbi:MAG: HEAT repeat domain-containing protein [Labilithrix sp.]|nr:HEAT repeat domain-containing protein [Labilithrix sp.]MCW5813883.1 HEAT repeat domain-containing protein [Labilithrix sp.]